MLHAVSVALPQQAGLQSGGAVRQVKCSQEAVQGRRALSTACDPLSISL